MPRLQKPQVNGTLWAWGNGGNGRLGLGDTTSRSSPEQVGSLATWRQVVAAQQHSAAIQSNGTLWAWGNGSSGQLGQVTNSTTFSSPVQVGSLTTWVAVFATRQNSTFGLQSNGTLWAWGSGSNGRLGDGSTTTRSSPVQIGTNTNWVMVAPGDSHILGLRTDGTLWSWGVDTNGQLGQVTSTTTRSSPVQIGTNTNWVAIAAADQHSVALRTDGTLWTWGSVQYGRLGDSATANRSSPVQIGSLRTWTTLMATGGAVDHSLASQSNGTLWTWGEGGGGVHGTSATTDYSSPVQVGSLTTWAKSISTATGHSAALMVDGTLWTWGTGSNGRLGHNNTTTTSSPIQVGSLNTWLQVSTGEAHTIAIRRN